MSANKTLQGLPALSRGKRWDHLELLERIDASGSISAAANTMGMSYKAAWQAVEAMNNEILALIDKHELSSAAEWREIKAQIAELTAKKDKLERGGA